MYGESFYEIIFRASVNRNKIPLDFSHSECYIYYTWNYGSTWIALQLLILLINVTNFYKIHAVFSLSWINPHLCFSAVTLGTTPLWAGHWGPTCQLNWALKPPGGRVWRSWRGLWRAWTLPVTGSVCLISTPLLSAPHRTSASRPTWATQSVCPSLCPLKIRVWHILLNLNVHHREFRPLNSHFPIVFFFVSYQVAQITSQPQVQSELSLRLTQLQTRLASLKIENEEVRHTSTPHKTQENHFDINSILSY